MHSFVAAMINIAVETDVSKSKATNTNKAVVRGTTTF